MLQKTLKPGLVILGLLTVVSAGAQGSTYTSPREHFSFTAPANWAPMQPADLQRIVSLSHVNYEAGYRQQGNIFPYLLVQIQPAPAGDPRQGIDEVRKNSGMQVDWDEARKRLVLRGTVALMGAAMQLTSYSFVGKTDVVSVHCYQLAVDQGRNEVIFEGIANSFHFDPGFDFDSRSAADSPILQGASHGALYGGIAGGLAGLFIALIQAAKKKRR